MAASPLDELPPDGEAKAGDGGENQSFTWCEEPVVESACADAAHDGELVLGFFAGQLRKRGPRHAGDMQAELGDGPTEVALCELERKLATEDGAPADNPQ